MILELVLVTIIGLTFGSFLGVVTKRLPRKESFVLGRSHCPKCGYQIAARDNIPLLSFVLLKGRCRNCRKRISLRYPLLEAATAIVFVAAYLVLVSCGPQGLSVACSFGDSLGVWVYPYLGVILLLTIAIFVIDLEKRIIPDELVFWGLAITCLAFIFGRELPFYGNLSAGFASGLFLLAIHLLTGGRGMGLGDVKYALFAGAFLGLSQALVWLFLAFLTGAAVGAILILLGKTRLKSKIAFGPFLALSFVLTAFYGDQILAWFMTI